MTSEQIQFFQAELFRDPSRALAAAPSVAGCIGGATLLSIFRDFVKTSPTDEGLLKLAKVLPRIQINSLPVLEQLAMNDETVIREAAVCSMIEMVSSSVPSVEALAVFHRLVTDSWFSSRVAAAQLLPGIYPSIPANTRSTARKAFLALFDEDNPMVRRAVGSRLAELLKVVEEPTEFIPAVSIMASDSSQESLRLAAVACCSALSGHKALADPIMATLAKDKSWRVRMVVARYVEKFPGLLLQSLRDPEPDVREAAVTAMIHDKGALLHAASSELGFLVSDVSSGVRGQVALLIGTLLKTKEDRALGWFYDLISDEVPQVRINALQAVHEVRLVDGKELAVRLSVQDPNWRVRLAVVNVLSTLAKETTFDILSAVLNGLSDPVFTVREEAIRQLPPLTRELGVAWLTDRLWPKLCDVRLMTALHAVKVCTEFFSDAQIKSAILPLLMKGLDDGVPIVQVCACRATSAVLPLLPETSGVSDAVGKLIESSDRDVASSAKQLFAQLTA